MRIKIIGENNCARATRHLLRLAGFAVTDFLPADAVIQGPAAGYAITINLSPAANTPNAYLGPDCATQQQVSSTSEEADRTRRDASSSSLTENEIGQISFVDATAEGIDFPDKPADSAPGATRVGGGLASYIHFDSVDSALETAVLRHITQLAAGPVIVDRPGGVVHSERELRIVAPCSGDARTDEAAAVAIEFGVLRGLLDLVAPDARGTARWNGAGKKLLGGDLVDVAADDAAVNGEAEETAGKTFASRPRKNWWPLFLVLIVGGLGVWSGGRAGIVAASGRVGAKSLVGESAVGRDSAAQGGLVGVAMESRRVKPASLGESVSSVELAGLIVESHRLKPMPLAAQGEFATGQGFKITDGVNFLVVDPCKATAKLYVSINQTVNTQLVAGTAAKKIYVCSIHVVAAAATDVAVVEGTGTVCATGTAGVSGFGGATAATGWNFAGNGGIALGNGDSSLGAEGVSGDNLCIFNSGSGQVSGGISYVVE